MSEPIEPEFYYSQSGAEVAGPVTAPALLDLLSSKVIDGQTLVTAQGMNSWIPLTDLLKSELFTTAIQGGEIPHNIAPPIRNPTLALGTLALLFTNPVTIGLAALGIPAYYLTRSKKRPPESILSALKPQNMREEEFLKNELLPEPGTTGPKAVLSFAEKFAWAFGEFCTERAERERLRRLKEIRQQEAFNRMVRLPPQSVSGWIFYSLVVVCIVIGGYLALFFDYHGKSHNEASNSTQVAVEPAPRDEQPATLPTRIDRQPSPPSKTTPEPMRVTKEQEQKQTQIETFPKEARLLKKYSISLEYGILGVRVGSVIQVTGKTSDGYSATFGGQTFTVKEGDVEFQKQ